MDLYFPPQDEAQRWNQYLKDFTTDSLRGMTRTLIQWLKKRPGSATAVDRDGTRKKSSIVYKAYISNASVLKKGEMISLIAFFLADERNFRAYLESLSPEERKVWEDALLNRFVSLPSTGYAKAESLPWFTAVRGKGEKDRMVSTHYLYLNHAFFMMAHPFFFPEKPTVLYKQLPEKVKTGLRFFSGEKDIFVYLHVLEELFRQGKLEANKTSLKASTLNLLSKTMHIKEFFPDSPDKNAALWRTSILAVLWSSGLANLRMIEKSPEQQLRLWLEKTIHFTFLTVPVLLPHLSGLRKNVTCSSYAAHLAIPVLKKASEASAGTWLHVPAFCRETLTDKQCYNYLTLFHHTMFEQLALTNTKQKRPTYLDRILTDVGLPYLRGLFFLLAAAGMAEIACREIQPEDASYTECLEYFRLTPLGAYALGQAKEYTPAKTEDPEEPLFELDDNHLILTALRENNPYEAMLNDMVVPIGKGCYHVTPEVFLANCHKTEELRKKIELFKRYVDTDLPPNWQEFFHSLLSRSEQITKIPATEYTILRLPANDKELHRIVFEDPEIRQHALRAEGYLLLVENQHRNFVVERLKKYGYLLAN